jgi:hypothetical protein
MFLDIHAPISGGRELWGFQQKLAAPRRHRDPRRYPLGSRNGPLLFKFAIVVLLAVFAVNRHSNFWTPIPRLRGSILQAE